MRAPSFLSTVALLAVVVVAVSFGAPDALAASEPLIASGAEQLRDLPARVDTSPDRMRFVRTGVVVGAVALIVAIGAFLTRGGDGG